MKISKTEWNRKFCSILIQLLSIAQLRALNSISLVAAGLDVEEFTNEVDLDCRRDANDKDLHDRPRADIAFVIFYQRVIAWLPRSRMSLELSPEEDFSKRLVDQTFDKTKQLTLS